VISTQDQREPLTSELDAYQGYLGLPPLISIESMARAVSQGLTVAESVERLKRVHWSLKWLHRIFMCRLASLPIYEIKMAFSLHSYYCAEHVAAIAKRVGEMRQPPYGLDSSPSDALDLFFSEILSSPTEEVLIVGIYSHALPAVVRSIDRLMRDTNKLFDHPTYRICRLMLLEMQEAQAYGEKAVDCLLDDLKRHQLNEWTVTLERILQSAGDLDGTSTPSDEQIEPMFSKVQYKYEPTPCRDERFRDPYNMGVNAEAMLFDAKIPPLPKSIMLYFKRMREIDVPEMMSSILVESVDRPWDFYLDMTRQLWDEARHAMMGEVGFASLRIDWTQIPFNFTWSLMLNTRLTVTERHAVLFCIEQGLMPKKTGKKFEWEIAVDSKNRLAILIQDYDWADEILHARIGRTWLVPEFGSQQKAMAVGDEAWSIVLVDWCEWKREGLTTHRNWWPDIYRQACLSWGTEPDPDILQYSTSYEHARADLKEISPKVSATAKQTKT
jgi:hypothetical protein